MSSKVFLLILVFLFFISTASATDEALSDSIKPVAAFTADITSGPAPLVVRFTDTGTGGVPASWNWDTGDGIYSKHAMNATHTFTKPGVYTVSLTVTNGAGSDTVSKTDYITVLSTPEAPEVSEHPEKPTATFTSDVTAGYAPLGVQFKSETTGNPTSYYWIFEPETSNDWNSRHPVTAVHTFKKPGVYTVSLVVTNSAGSYTVTEPDYITVLDPAAPVPAQKPAASFTADVTSGKVPLEVRFADTGTGGAPASWYWNFGDGTHSTDAKTATHTFTSPGTYTVTLTVTNDAGSDTESITGYIKASSALKAPIANFYSTQVQQAITSGKSLSVPATVSFIDCSTGSPATWLWDFGDGETSTNQNPVHTYVEAGSYSIKLTVSNDAGSNTISRPYYVLTSVKEQPADTQTDSVNNNHQTNSVNDNRQTTTVNNNYQITNVNNYNSSPFTEQGENISTERSALPSSSVSLYGEKTNVVNGEEVLLKLSVVNLITKPAMHVQVIIIPPSGMSVSSTGFAESGAGQYMAKYYLEPGTGRDIEVKIVANQAGNFNVNGRVVYYFGENKQDAEDYAFNLPIQVEEAPDIPDIQPEPAPETRNVVSGFGVPDLVLMLSVVFLLRRN
ncbi:PKD domain-containing protein [Methanosarcina sp. MSH10X1]|uniref:PKD domain-containing protein n=1 Tax=Methanosarcina sp. MSH10X1 TaxID=2507075 RepID=UPI000FFBC903|nr:PKD domain-containing protein [Methanosarcina sp. MSH10X1]RXA17603.1 PKD domain-containing protein [Methanosarcina sp. MSH10X1]